MSIKEQASHRQVDIPEIAGMSAILQFDSGQRRQGGGDGVSRYSIWETYSGRREDGKRLYGAERQADKVQKKRRVAQRQAKVQRESKKLLKRKEVRHMLPEHITRIRCAR